MSLANPNSECESTREAVRQKWQVLQERLRSLGRVLVAYSGGVDSTFLAKACHDVLGDQALMVTAISESLPGRERERALALAAKLGFNHRALEHSELQVEAFVQNTPERCYFCKRALFKKLRQVAAAENIPYILDGTTADDLNDFRPGQKAAREGGVLSPLLEAGMRKDEIRLLSRGMGLSTWDQPSSACLASRIPYGEAITGEKLLQIEEAENFLHGLGIALCRVRHHGTMARIEVAPATCLDLVMRERSAIVSRLRALGFAYVALDLAGYRTGSLNETL